jgi:peptidoglycan/xylan/chitin deacetylase (PgdA/CDA1 family)
MIVRRIVVSLVLVLFASVTIGIIVGLDDTARSALAGNVGGSPAPTRTWTTPAPTRTPTTATQTPQSTPKPEAPTTAPSASPPPTSRAERATAKPSPKPTARPSPKPTAKPSPKPRPRYLKGPLKKGAGGTVYLTFDDGPGPYTSPILDILDRTSSTATFFHLGVNEPGYPHVDAEIRAQGSKVGNHTYDHPDLTTLTAKQLRRQLARGPAAKCFRPPFGAADKAVRRAIRDAGMREVRWDVDSFDWTKPGAATLAESGRLKSVRDGSIVLLHDGGGDRSQTVTALPRIIADLQARGFKIRALPYC